MAAAAVPLVAELVVAAVPYLVVCTVVVVGVRMRMKMRMMRVGTAGTMMRMNTRMNTRMKVGVVGVMMEVILGVRVVRG